jgi:hypothetical protein
MSYTQTVAIGPERREFPDRGGGAILGGSFPGSKMPIACTCGPGQNYSQNLALVFLFPVQPGMGDTGRRDRWPGDVADLTLLSTALDTFLTTLPTSLLRRRFIDMLKLECERGWGYHF